MEITEFVFNRTTKGVETNFKQVVIHHSPSGLEFGYGGSGPADSALNVLEHALQQTGYQGKRTKCFRGSCFELAWSLHQQFKWDYISPMSRTGGSITLTEVLAFIELHKHMQEG